MQPFRQLMRNSYLNNCTCTLTIDFMHLWGKDIKSSLKKYHFCMPNVYLWVLQSNYTGTVICFVLNVTTFVPTSDFTCNCPFGVCNSMFALLHAYFGEYKPVPHGCQWNKWSMVASHWEDWFCMQILWFSRSVDFWDKSNLLHWLIPYTLFFKLAY